MNTLCPWVSNILVEHHPFGMCLPEKRKLHNADVYLVGGLSLTGESLCQLSTTE